MGKNNKVQKLKICPVCVFLEDEEDLSIKVNSLLKITDKITPKIEPLITDLISSKNIKTPSAYNLNKHKNDCLKDFIPVITNLKIIENQEISELNIDLEKFKKMTLVERDLEYQNILHELYYKKLVGLNNEKKVNKDEINALKSLYDLISVNNIDVSKLTFNNNSKDIEKTGIELIRLVLSKQLISEKITMDVAKLLFNDFKEIKNIEENQPNMYLTDDELKHICSLINKGTERSKNFTLMEWDDEKRRLYQEEELKKENLDLQNN
jgi:hypothetical protein